MPRATNDLTRRDWMRLASAGIAAASTSGWIEALAAGAARDPRRRRSCILLWMTGGPSQIDTFDPKPGHANNGPFQPIDTAVPGVQIGEHLPKVAARLGDLAVIRSMSTKEGDHGRATYHLRTGYMPSGQIQYPTFGSIVAKEYEDTSLELPGFVSIAPFRLFNQAAFGPGFLGQEYAPLIVGDSNSYGGGPGGDVDQLLQVKDLKSPANLSLVRADHRLQLLENLNSAFTVDHPSLMPQGHRTAYDRAVKLMRSPSAKAFQLDEEPGSLRDAYGRNPFGQGCLLARRLVERGVPFVEVSLNSSDGNMNLGWDSHQQNFDAVKALCGPLDAGWATLLRDLKQRGLLDDTLVVWMGEFGRTPKINGNGGRDHYPNAWTTVLGGGGIRGGQVVGRTSADGTTVADRPVSVPDLMATICLALGIDPKAENLSNVGRPIKVADRDAKPIAEALA